MPTFDTIILCTMAGLALSASPGPSMLYVLSRSVSQDYKAGLASTMGLAIGGMILAVASALGLTLVISQSDILYSGIRVIGAIYLIYLGVEAIGIVGKKEDLSVDKIGKEPLDKILIQGIWVEVLNPKTILFFLAFIPQFVDKSIGSVSLQTLILGMLVPLTAIPSDIIVSFCGGAVAQQLSKKPMASTILNWVAGLILIGLGLRIFLLD